MNRQQAKELLPIIKAYAEGRTIQYYYEGEGWIDVTPNEVADFSDNPSKYRIKTGPTYRPFKTKAECWQEMQKHQPFGWVKSKFLKHFKYVVQITDNSCVFSHSFGNTFDDMYKEYTFADGTPFGIKE